VVGGIVMLLTYSEHSQAPRQTEHHELCMCMCVCVVRQLGLWLGLW
jgi:hypothetical protein